MIVSADRVIAREGDLEPGYVEVRDGRIESVRAGVPTAADAAFREGTLVPGFVDLQVNGGAGVDLLDCSEADAQRVSSYLASTGTTGFLATLISSPADRVRAALRVLRRARPQGAEILGVHLEGPVLNPTRRGAHPARWLRAADDPEVHALYAEALPDLRVVTLAPELPGSADLIAWLLREHVVVSIGHSDASYEEATRALEQGARMVTHLFNAMRPFHHRDPGVVGATLDDRACVCGLIADGVHVHPAVVRLAHRVLGPHRIALVTDALAAAGMPRGEYTLAGEPIRLTGDGPPRLGDGTLAGSALRMDAAVANLVRWGIPLRDAVCMASTTPARVLGLADRGEIAPGKRADLCVLGPDGRAVLTLVCGRVAYRRGA